MARPKKNRIVAYNPGVSYFKPRGIPMVSLEEVCLSVDEREAVRLADLLGMSYDDGGQKMGVSRATFGRIVQEARKIIADALINGKAINVEGGNYTISCDARIFSCCGCDHKWEEFCDAEQPLHCPSCSYEDIKQSYREKKKKNGHNK